MSEQELTWSSFLRAPASVERQLKRGDVLLRRRKGGTLRLSRESSHSAQREALLAAVRLLAPSGAQAKSRIHLSETEIGERLPWTRLLPASDRAAFAEEFLGVLEACADLGQFTAIGVLIEDWKATAKLHSEGLAARLRTPIDRMGGRVKRP